MQFAGALAQRGREQQIDRMRVVADASNGVRLLPGNRPGTA
jgi:hypothetical protein